MLLKIYSKMDAKNKITLPRGIRRELDIRPGETLELKVMGIKNARKLLVSRLCQPRSFGSTLKPKGRGQCRTGPMAIKRPKQNSRRRLP